MIFNEVIKFKTKKKLFFIKQMKPINVNKNYICTLNSSKFLKQKKKYSIFSQKKYVRNNIISSKNYILGIFSKKEKVLAGSINTQFIKKKKLGKMSLKNFVAFGILIFGNFQKKGIGKKCVLTYSDYLLKKKNYKYILSAISKQNKHSIYVFKNAGFKKLKYTNQSTCYFLKK